MQDASGKALKKSRKAFITSMKASMKSLVVFTSTEAFVETLLDACVEVIFVEVFECSISSIEGFVEPLWKFP